MNFDASEVSGTRKVKVVDTGGTEETRTGEERLSSEERRRRRLGSLGGEIVC